MKAKIERMTGLLKVTTGHVMVEYSVILVAIAILCIAVIQGIGLSTGSMYTKVEPGLR